MTEPNTEKTPTKKPPAAKKAKKPAIEDKPFNEFMEEYFNPALKSALTEKGIDDLTLHFQKASIPITGLSKDEEYWQIVGTWQNQQRQFNIYFLDENIKGKKAFSYTTNDKKPSTLESFMIDERKVTLDLMVLYTLQRLNGQKWFTGN